MGTLFDLEVTGGTNVGLTFCYGLWGITAAQTYAYYRSFPFDPLYIKITVGFVCAATTVFIVLHEVCFHTQLLHAAPNRQHADTIPATYMVATTSAFMTVFAVQATYALRIHRLWKKPYIPLICWIGALYCFATQVAFVVQIVDKNIQVFYQLSAKYDWLIFSAYFVNAAVDVLISSTLCYLIQKDRDHVQRRTMRILDKLSLWTLETGLATSLTAIIVLILFKVDKGGGPRTAFALVLTSLHPLSLLGLLNGRAQLRVAKTNQTQDSSAIEFRTRTIKTIDLTMDAAADSSQDLQKGEIDGSRSTLAAKGVQLGGNKGILETEL